MSALQASLTLCRYGPSTRKGDTLGPDNGGDSVQPYQAYLTPFELSAPRPIHTYRLRVGFQHIAHLSNARSGVTTPVHSRCDVFTCSSEYTRYDGLCQVGLWLVEYRFLWTMREEKRKMRI